MSTIYFDNNATTAIDPAVGELLVRLWGTAANASSQHHCGQRARALWQQALSDCGAVLGVDAQQLVITSGGTEALNLCLLGYAASRAAGHLITSDLEHAAVSEPIALLERRGWTVTRLSPGHQGAPTVEEVRCALRPTTALIALMAANNETGVVTDIESIGSLADEHGIPLLVDGVAWLGKGSLLIPKGVSFFCASAHKLHGPHGVGVAFVRKDIPLEPIFYGGGQQRRRRPGTENVAGAAALALALQLCQRSHGEWCTAMVTLRRRLEEGLLTSLPGVEVNGTGERLCNTVNLFFEGVDGEELLIAIDRRGLCASMGSACSSGALEPSKVLLNMGYSRERVMSSLRLTLSRYTTQGEVDAAIEILIDCVRRLRR